MSARAGQAVPAEDRREALRLRRAAEDSAAWAAMATNEEHGQELEAAARAARLASYALEGFLPVEVEA